MRYLVCLYLLAWLAVAAESALSPEEKIAGGAAVLGANRLAADRKDQAGRLLHALAGALDPTNEDYLRTRLRLDKDEAPEPIATAIDSDRFLVYLLSRADYLVEKEYPDNREIGRLCMFYYLAARAMNPGDEDVEVQIAKLRADGFPADERQLFKPGQRLAIGRAAAVLRPTNVPEDAVEYNGHWYKFFPSKQQGATWQAAKEFCEKQGGYLARFETRQERNRLQQICRGRNAWIGGRYDEDSRTWRWTNGKKITVILPRDNIRETMNRAGHFYLMVGGRHRRFENRPMDGIIEEATDKQRRWREVHYVEGCLCEWE